MNQRYPLWESLVPPSDYGREETTATHAKGTRIRFADGRWALCATSGLWNTNLGYGNPEVTRAISTSLGEASYLSLFRAGHRPAVEAARALLDVCGAEHFGRVLFSTSGGAANDAVLKLVRHYWMLRGDPARSVVVGLKGSYHGLTFGGFALTNGTCGAAAVVVSHEICEQFERSNAVLVHGETQAGAPSTCAAILATIAEADRIGACERSVALGRELDAVRTVVDQVWRARAVVQPAPSAIQLVPALVYTSGEIAELKACMEEGLDAAAGLLS